MDTKPFNNPLPMTRSSGRMDLFLYLELSNKGYMIHGHIHNDRSMDFWPLLAARSNVLNAGCDINGFTPVTFDELLENNARFKQIAAERGSV